MMLTHVPPRIQLIDFEYCIEAEEAQLHGDQSCGTKELQAEETLKSPAEYSFASDMFSMGRCLPRGFVRDRNHLRFLG